jgi:hypothetical protein
MRSRKPPSPDALNPVPLFVVALILFVTFAMVQFMDDGTTQSPEQAPEAVELDFDLISGERGEGQSPAR